MTVASTASARVGGMWGTDLVEVTSDVARLDSHGRWAVAIPFSGAPVCARFATWTPRPAEVGAGGWRGPDPSAWATSMDEVAYVAAVESVRAAIERGDVYQANVCRVMSAPLPDASSVDVTGLSALLDTGNPSPFGGHLRLPAHDVHIASASPELFVSLRRDGDRRVARSGPIKGTGRVADDLSDKDAAENVMIVDLVRNDLSIVSLPGTVRVPTLLEVQTHPGLVHLVSFVEGDLRPGTSWADLLAAAFPPGSVTGAPKLAALDVIARLEPMPRSYYCGAFGWVDADTGEAELAVAIRTFWIDDGRLMFGTGAGITWGSDPHAEWRETELKAERLVRLAGGTWPTADPAAWQAGAP